MPPFWKFISCIRPHDQSRTRRASNVSNEQVHAELRLMRRELNDLHNRLRLKSVQQSTENNPTQPQTQIQILRSKLTEAGFATNVDNIIQVLNATGMLDTKISQPSPPRIEQRETLQPSSNQSEISHQTTEENRYIHQSNFTDDSSQQRPVVGEIESWTDTLQQSQQYWDTEVTSSSSDRSYPNLNPKSTRRLSSIDSNFFSLVCGSNPSYFAREEEDNSFFKRGCGWSYRASISPGTSVMERSSSSIRARKRNIRKQDKENTTIKATSKETENWEVSGHSEQEMEVSVPPSTSDVIRKISFEGNRHDRRDEESNDDKDDVGLESYNSTGTFVTACTVSLRHDNKALFRASGDLNMRTSPVTGNSGRPSDPNAANQEIVPFCNACHHELSEGVHMARKGKCTLNSACSIKTGSSS